MPPGFTKKYEIKKSGLGTPKFYVFQESKSACVFCSLSYTFFFVDDKISSAHFKDRIIPSLNAKDRLKFAQDVEIKNEREKGKSQ